MNFLPFRFVTKLVLALLAASSLMNCSGVQKVLYAKYGKLKLYEGESNSIPVNNNDLGLFEACCYAGSDLIFLNRAIHNTSGQYDIFISVSEQLMPGQFSQIQSGNSEFQQISSKSELVGKVKVDAYAFKKGEYFITRFVYIETKSGLLVIYDCVSKQEAIVKSIFDAMSSYLNEKIRI